MCHIAELVIGGCVLIAMTTLGVVAILGVLGVLEMGVILSVSRQIPAPKAG